MKNIETEIVIDAKPDVVWNTLMKTDEYEEWNPFVRKLGGKVEKGGQGHATKVIDRSVEKHQPKSK